MKNNFWVGWFRYIICTNSKPVPTKTQANKISQPTFKKTTDIISLKASPTAVPIALSSGSNISPGKQ